MRLLRSLETLPLDNSLNGWTCTFFALASSTRAKLVPKANWHTKVPRTKSRKWCSLHRRHPKKRPPSESQDSRTNHRFRYIGFVWPGGVREDAWLANFLRSLASQPRTSQVLNARHGGQTSAEHRQSRRHGHPDFGDLCSYAMLWIGIKTFMIFHGWKQTPNARGPSALWLGLTLTRRRLPLQDRRHGVMRHLDMSDK